MPRNANAIRITDICNELAHIRARLSNSAAAITEGDQVKAETFTDAADAIGKVFESLWGVAGAIAQTPDPNEAEWARLLAAAAKPKPASE